MFVKISISFFPNDAQLEKWQLKIPLSFYMNTQRLKCRRNFHCTWSLRCWTSESIDINSIYNNFYCTIKKQNALKSYTLHFDNNKKKKKLNRIGKQQFNYCFDILFLFCFVCCICFRCCFLLRKLKTKIAGYQTSVCINNVAMSLASDYIHSGTGIYKRTRHRHLTDIVLSV